MIINEISSPDDLKRISKEYLPDICANIRNIIIDTCSKNGGHLAPSMGVVELAVALHYVFDSPNDKLVWDVGHQSYAHKILTGRRNIFHTLRQAGGLSGFPKRSESPHDVFGTGHSSTSISSALGIAQALSKKKSQNRAIAIIGDGSMTGGLAFEALNLAGHKVGNLIIILNDNEMSISPNVGALSKFLSVNLHSTAANKVRYHLKKIFLLIPFVGRRIYKFLEKAQEATLGFLTPGHLFEAFGCNYIGPLDGHNLTELISVFKNIKDSPIDDKPTLIHVITKKGRGYKPAEENPTKFHGIGPFCRETGVVKSNGNVTFTKVFDKTMLNLARKNPKLVGITAAMASGTGLDTFAKEFPSRFFDVGIAEEHAVTFSAGLSTQGYRPVVAIYSTFLQRAYDQIIHDVCLQKLPIIFAIDRAGLVGEDGATHHGAFDISYMRTIPNMVLMAPRDGEMLEKMLTYAVNYDGPTAIRYPRGKSPDIQTEDADIPLKMAKSEIVYEKADPQTIVIAVGHLVAEAVKAAKFLDENGIGTIVVDPRFIKPFDFDLLKRLIAKCPNILTIEENMLAGGVGSMIAEWICQNNIENVKLKCIGIPDCFVEHGPQKYLRQKLGLDAAGIQRAVTDYLDGDKARVTRKDLNENTSISIN